MTATPQTDFSPGYAPAKMRSASDSFLPKTTGKKALKTSKAAFTAAYLLKKGQGYEEEKAFLASAEKQVLKKMWKRIKGY